jgi:type VI protein secretion system component VasF
VPYDAGDFEHCFEQRDVMASDELERAQAQAADGAALKNYVDAGMPLEIAVQEVWGWSEERAAQFTADRLEAIQREQMVAQSDVPADPAVAAVQQ